MPSKFSPILHDTHREPYEGHKDVAPVLASAALEDAMKKLATKNGITLSDDSGLSRIIAGPKPERVIGGTQAAMLSGMPKLRDAAMHANWQKITDPKVRALIAFVEGLIALHFSLTD